MASILLALLVRLTPFPAEPVRTGAVMMLPVPWLILPAALSVSLPVAAVVRLAFSARSPAVVLRLILLATMGPDVIRDWALFTLTSLVALSLARDPILFAPFRLTASR